MEMRGFLPEFRQLARYLLVGAATNVLALAIYYVATLLAGIEPKRALTIATAVAFVSAYATNRAWTFGSDAGVRRSLLRYAAGYAASYVLQLPPSAVLGLPGHRPGAAGPPGVTSLAVVA
jgi:putative flippase GtrA